MRILFLLLALGISAGAFGQAAHITFLTEKVYRNPGGSTDQFASDKEATSFTSQGKGAPVYIKLDFKEIAPIKAKDKLMLWVAERTSGGENYAYSQEMRVPKKTGSVEIKSTFMPGEYVARLYDKDNESDVYGSANFSVADGGAPDYKNNSTMVACASVNDDWNPVGETKKIKTGTCVSFLYKASKSLPPIKNYFMVWAIRKVSANGEEEYVNDLLQNAGDDGWRFLATDNLCEFRTAGKYRVYILEKSESDALHGVVGHNYFGKMELMVE